LQVAQLAGVPTGVIRAARKHLARLEAQALDATPQLDLFALAPCDDAAAADADEEVTAAAPAPSPALDLLDAIDPDALTPREALERLYELKRLASASA
jgi:DNA mismatch repair protein MutS